MTDRALALTQQRQRAAFEPPLAAGYGSLRDGGFLSDVGSLERHGFLSICGLPQHGAFVWDPQERGRWPGIQWVSGFSFIEETIHSDVCPNQPTPRAAARCT